MKQVSISEFRANLLMHLKTVQGGQQMNITSKGKLMATLVPPLSQQAVAQAALAKLAETAVINDVISPVDESWDAMK